ncbi:MAG: acylphosphatase [Pseudomonadota bacterium]|nr:acylphosphatase [Pseudomonadota bacterium]
MKTRLLRIHGRVQGVWFRESMFREAGRLGITGWVRNQADGSVEAVIQGPDAAVDAMLDWTRIGPPLARVERVDVSETQGQFDGFEKRID